jgi:hypothetical protein
MVTCEAVKGAPKGAFILTLDSPASYFTIELGTKGNAVQLSFVPWLASTLRRTRSGILHHHRFVSGHRTFWNRFEPSPLGNSGRRHPTVAMLLSAL